jgi:ferredoxin
MMKLLPARRLADFLECLASKSRLYGPVAIDGQVRLEELSGRQPALEPGSPINSLKSFLYPQTEAVFAFEGGYTDVTLQVPPPPISRVIFGVRPCDAVAGERVSRVLLAEPFTDQAYRERRKLTTILTVACREAGPHCFCRSVGVSPADRRGSDVILYPTDDDYQLEAVTPQGEALLRSAEALLDPGDGDAGRVACERTPVPELAQLEREDLAARLEATSPHPHWTELARRCLGCGVCTFLCPTCYCFAMFDTVRGTRGRRSRGWDSCQFKEYSLMAGGHEPLPTKASRLRRRFLHKLSRFPAVHGDYACVGCGRCGAACPVNLHLAGVLTELEEVLR